jgi:hypothetical protein
VNMSGARGARILRLRRDAIVTATADASVESAPFACAGSTCGASCQRAALLNQTGDSRGSSRCSRGSRAPSRRRRRAVAAYDEREAVRLARVPDARGGQREYECVDAQEHGSGYRELRHTVRGG